MLDTTRNLVYLSALSLSLVSSQTFAAREPLTLAPSSKWSINYGKDSCRLSRSFGEGDDSTLLLMERFTNNNGFTITLIGKKMDIRESSSDAVLQFGPYNNEQNSNYLTGDYGKNPALFLTSTINIRGLSEAEKKSVKKNKIFVSAPISELEEKNTTSLIIKKPLKQPLILNTGTMHKPLKSLRDCMDNVMTSWGFDPKEQNSLTSSPTPTNNPGKWIRSADYPSKALTKGQRAIVDFRLNIDESGSVRDCHILKSIGNEEFDKVSCQRIMKKAKFSPALSSDNKPVKSFWINRITFTVR